MSSSQFVVNPSACFQPISQLSILNVSPTVVLSEEALCKKSMKEAEQCCDPVHRLRLRCLAIGLSGPKLLIRKLISLGKQRIKMEDFIQAVASIPGMKLSEEDVQNAFNQLASPTETSKEIEIDELIKEIMPPISGLRRTLVERLFTMMDPQGQGSIPLSSLAQMFDHRRHPKFQSGAKSREDLFQAFLDQFKPDPDGQIMAQEFMAFYAAQSAAVDSDIHFDWLVRNIWKI